MPNRCNFIYTRCRKHSYYMNDRKLGKLLFAACLGKLLTGCSL
jgi:hypothetical protein